MSDTHVHDQPSPHSHNAAHDEHSHRQDAHQHGGAAEDNYTDLLELDAAVLPDYWSAALDWVRDESAGAPRTRLLDLGAGTGVGAIGLAQRFPEAAVVALDVSPAGLARVHAKARPRPRPRAARADG